jgi:Cu(I)/Ag(I) efflux system membrane fusion protein
VRTQPVERRVLARPVLVPGAVRIDERRIKVVALRMDGFIEDLFVNATGQTVRAGQPLFRVYSPQVQQAQVDLLTALREQDRSGPGAEAQRRLEGPIQRLRNLGIPEARIREVVDKRSNPRTIDWPSPSSGVVLEKRVIDGQRAVTGDELYRIADLMAVWVIAEVPERELAFLRVGDPASVTFLAYPGDVREGRLTFVYPDVNPETRTVRVRIELPNPDGRLKLDMYADVTLQAGAGDAAAIAVPESALIDSGTRQVVIVARGDGRFEPRPVKTGRRGDGHVEITEGLAEGEEVVTTATFLIDAESNLQAALRALTAPEARR